MGEPLAKKIRVWNPALEEPMVKEESSPSVSPPQPLDFSKPAFPQQMPVLMQNYINLAPLMMRMQQQQMETAMRQRFLTSLAHQSRLSSAPSKPFCPPDSATMPLTPIPGVAPSFNPLVASALGVHPVSENCCAVCGASFRLTGDLVTHMRNNHRRTRFKRKNEKPVD